jgi:hypothetical protein
MPKLPRLPVPLELPEGNQFVLPPVAAVPGQVIPAGSRTTYIRLIMKDQKELLIPIDREIAQQIDAALQPLLKKDKS